MQSEKVVALKKRLRNAFRDDFATQWSDALLNRIIIEAQREYALYSGRLLGKVKLTANGSAVLKLPEDFIQVVNIFDASGEILPVVSYRYLVEKYGDFREITGNKARYGCFNFEDFGTFRIFPILPSGTDIGTLIYKRLPSDTVFEVKDINAVEQYALYQMYQFTGKRQASVCYVDFISQIDRYDQTSLSSGNNTIQRTGNFF